MFKKKVFRKSAHKLHFLIHDYFWNSHHTILDSQMGKLARIHARKNYCANDVIPMYERYYEQVLAGALVARV